MTYGTRGDIEPFVALALGLKGRGHRVTIASAERYGDWVKGFGIGFAPLTNRSIDLFQSPEMRVLMEHPVWHLRKRRAANQRLMALSQGMFQAVADDCLRAFDDSAPDLVVYHPKLSVVPHIAEARGVPVMMALLQPMLVPTRDFAPISVPALPLPGWNRFSYRLVDLAYGFLRKRVNAFRTGSLHLDTVRGRRGVMFPPRLEPMPVLHAISGAVLPRPDDWPNHAHMTGFWQMPQGGEAFEPSEELLDFLAAGPPPVYIGFGSMMASDPAELSRIVTDALRQVGMRGVIGAGWAGLDAMQGDDLITVPAMPHGWLFPQMAAIVHHGGAGTTAQAMAAGVPSVICPFFGDQPFWAKRAQRLGVGTAPVARTGLTADKLARAIRQAVSDKAMQENARALGKAMRAEDGVATASDVIEAHLAAQTKGG